MVAKAQTVTSDETAQAPLVTRGAGTVSRRFAIRVCQPGPVAFQRAMTSGGKRRLIICLGWANFGLPAFLKTEPVLNFVCEA